MTTERETVGMLINGARASIRSALRLLVEQGGNLSLRDELHRVVVRLDVLNDATALGAQEARKEESDGNGMDVGRWHGGT